jgi:thiamine biosynthesis protein ThiC
LSFIPILSHALSLARNVFRWHDHFTFAVDSSAAIN